MTPPAGMATTVAPNPWQGFLWLSRRECHRVLRLWTQTTLAPVVSSLLFIVVFGLLGGRISVIQGYEYEQFIVPGLIAMAMAQAAYSNNASTIFQGRNDRFIDDVLAAPIHHWQVNVGYLIGGAFRALTSSASGSPHSPSRSPAPRSSTHPCCSLRSSFSSAASAPSARSSGSTPRPSITPASSTTS